jgi:hypothetical protein
MIAINKLTGAKIEITRYGLRLLGENWEEYNPSIELDEPPAGLPGSEEEQPIGDVKPYPYEDIAEDFKQEEILVTVQDQPEAVKVVPEQETDAPEKAQPKNKPKRERK